MNGRVLFLSLLLSHEAIAQHTAAPGEPIILGIAPDAYVDVTGDGIADLLITGHTEHVSDPEQPGFLGRYKQEVRTLPGTAILSWSTPSNQHWYTVDTNARLDTAELAARIHFKQLSWTDPAKPIEFRLLERPFGPGITRDADGWSADEHYEGNMVLRSTSGTHTGIATFAFELPYPYGRIVIRTIEAVQVPNGFGKEGDPLPPKPKVKPAFDFGHEEVGPQVIIPAGLPPDEAVDLTFDEVPDVIIIGTEHPGEGFFTRGVSPAPGTAFLMQRAKWGASWDLFRLGEEEVLTPERLSSGLEANIYMWASPERESVFCPVLRHRSDPYDKSTGWAYCYEAAVGDPIFRTMHYGQPVIGVVALRWQVPGGELSVDPQNWVEEGKALQVR